MKKAAMGLVFILVACIFITENSMAGKLDWKYVGSREGIDTYSRKVDGSRLLEIRAVTVANARMEVISEVLRDIPAATIWRPFCTQAKIVEKSDRDNMVVYNVTNIPWPFMDRDVAAKASVLYELDYGRGFASIKKVEHSQVPLKKGMVRLPTFFADYLFEFIHRDHTGIIFTTRVDPGGIIPDWVSNIFTKQYAYMEIKALLEMVEKEKYIEAGKTSKDLELIESMMGSPKTVKKVFTNRVREFVRDEAFVEEVVKHRTVDEMTSLKNVEVAKVLLYSWTSREGKVNSVKMVLEDHLKKFTDDRALITSMTDDKTLISKIIDGNLSRPSVPEIIKSRLTAAGNLKKRLN